MMPRHVRRRPQPGRARRRRGARGQRPGQGVPATRELRRTGVRGTARATARSLTITTRPDVGPGHPRGPPLRPPPLDDLVALAEPPDEPRRRPALAAGPAADAEADDLPLVHAEQAEHPAG